MNTDQYTAAQERVESRFLQGAKQEEALLAAVAETVIVDRLVPPRQMTFIPLHVGAPAAGIKLRYRVAEGMRSSDDTDVSIHRHALGQLCGKVSLPMNFVNMLNTYIGKEVPTSKAKEDWKRELLCHNLNELFGQPEWTERGGAPTRFLHRIVGGELRGFLSRRYNRHLASAPLLRAFVESCRHHDARPIESTATSVRVALKYLLPKVFEAFPGEYVCLGSEWANSDFGAGRLTVRQTVWRIATGTSSVLDETFGRVHLGSVIEDSDIEMSDDTAKKEVDAQKGAIRDAVTAQFSSETVDRLLGALRLAHEQQVPWGKLRGQLGRFLGKSDIGWLQAIIDTGESIIDLPPLSFDPDGGRVPNLYWASSAVSALASKTDDTDRRLELQREAGKLLAAALEDV
jgi:hypothetical protein